MGAVVGPEGWLMRLLSAMLLKRLSSESMPLGYASSSGRQMPRFGDVVE